MKKNLFSKIMRRGIQAAFALSLAFASVSCDVGLGESVDTESPSLSITYPPVSAVIRDSFVLYGTCTDDKEVSSVKVSVMNTSTKETLLTDVPAQVSGGAWRITLNAYDSEKYSKYNGWQFADGTYQVSAVASDNAGHTSDAVSRTFDIDNTAPLFIISNPGVVKSGSSSASAYGSVFTVEGTIAELHEVSSMAVKIYDGSGNVVSKETYNGEEIDSFREESIGTAGGTSVVIAQWEGSGSSGERYKDIYGDSKDNGTQKYTCSVTLTDSAQKYVTPPDSDSRTAAEIKSDSNGNSSSVVYLYDEVYDSLLSQKNESSLKLSAAALMNILNGNTENDGAKTILENAAIETASPSDESKRLYFSLNPDASPTYQINGFEYNFEEDSSLASASSGNPVTVAVSSGLDGTGIDLDGNSGSKSTVKVWMKEYEARPSDKSSVKSELNSLAASVYKKEQEDFENSSQSFAVYSKDNSSAATSFDGWTLIYDYEQINGTNGGDSSATSKNFSVTLPEGSITLNNYYLLAVTGQDIDGIEFSQDTVYGFEGNEAGVAPTITFNSANSIAASSSDANFSGKANVLSASLYVSSITATLSVTDQDTGLALKTFTETISRSSDSADFKNESGSEALSCAGQSWTFTPSKLSGYEDIRAESGSGKSYLYTLEIYAKSSSGHTSTAVSSNIQIDSKAPVVSISSVTPTVDGYSGTEGLFANGTITVKGSVEETNLSSVSMEIFIGDSSSAAKTIDLGKVYSFSEEIDTTEFATIKDSAKSIKIVVSALDIVKNSGYCSSADDVNYKNLQIWQETDRPVITLNNASNSSEFTSGSGSISAEKGNLFGTVSNNKISVSVSDDDCIKSVTMAVYDENGKKIDTTTKDTIGKTTYSNSFALPEDEGVYKIEISAVDSLLSTDLSESREAMTASTGKFYVAVSAGAPTIKIDSVNTYLTSSPKFTGSVSSAKAKVSAAFTLAKINGKEADESSLAEISEYLAAQKNDDSTDWEVSLADLKTLENGDYTIRFTVSNDYGESNSQDVSFTVDDTAPALKVTEYNSIKAEDSGFTDEQKFYFNPENIKTIKGEASDSGSGIEGVYFFVGDIGSGKDEPSSENGWTQANLTKSSGSIGWTISLSDLSVENGEDYKVHIKAKDNAGNASSDNSLITLCIDTDGPVITDAKVSDEPGAAYTSGEKEYKVYGSNTFNVTANVSDSRSGVASVSANSAGKLSAQENAENVYTGSATASADASGFAAITISAADNVGNTAEFTIDNIYIDTAAPELKITSYPEKAQNGEFTLSGTASDNIGIAGIVVTDSLDSSKTYSATVTETDGATSWNLALTPSKDGNGNDTGKNYTADGSHTYTVTATDKVGNKTSASCRVTTDTTAPAWYTDSTDSKAPYIKTSGKTITLDSAEYGLYKSASISLAAKAKDETSGVAGLLYNLNGEKTESSASSAEKWSEADNGNLAVESGVADGLNTLKIKAVDEAGNESSVESIVFFVDSAEPEEPVLKSIDSDSDKESMAKFFAQNTQKLVNGTKDVVFTLKILDSGESETGSTEESSKTYSGIASVVLSKIGNTKKEINGVASESDPSVYTITIPSGDLASGSVTVTATDNAGNSASFAMFNLLVDKTAPAVKLTSPSDADSSTSDKRDVNGTISLSASATDNQSVVESSALLQYSTDKSEWKNLTKDNAGSDFAVVCTDSAITVTGLDTTKFNDKSAVYIRAAISDEAENIGYSDAAELYINQDSDRPSIKISNLTMLSDGSFILKYGEDAQLTGTVSDDDSTSESVVETLVISESPYTGKENASGKTEFTKSTGDFTFTPSDTSDGEKTLYFYIKDNAGNEFYTTASTGTSDNKTYLKNPKLYCKTEQLEDSAAAAAFKYKSDSTSPQVNNIEGRILESASARSADGYSGISVSLVAGGDSRYLQLKITASDANGIDGILLDVTDSSGNALFKRATAKSIAGNEISYSETESDGNFSLSNSEIAAAQKYYVNSSDTKTGEGTNYTWELFSYLDLEKVPTGALTVTAKAYDKSGLLGNGSQTFMLDNSGPAVTMTSPASTTTVSGSSVNVSGTTAETGGSTVASIQWLIPKTSLQGENITDSQLAAQNDWQGNLSSASSASAWTFVFNGNDNPLLSEYTKDTSYATADDDGIYSLPIYFKAADSLGNVTICRGYTIKYNPDADRPVAEITYPDSSILTAGGYAVLGGKIRVTGTVEIPSGDSTAYNVYLQISDDDGDFDDEDKEKAKDTYGFDVLDASSLETAWKKAESSASSLNFSNDESANTAKKKAWWGIPATLYSSKTSWYIVINENEKMNAKEGTNNVKIRVCGVGSNGKVGLWSSAYSIHIDSLVPRFGESTALRQYGSSATLASGEDFYKAEAAAEQSYSSGIYLKGQWYICATVTDETAVKINSVTLGSSKLSSGTDYFVYPSDADNSSGSAKGSSLKASNDSSRSIAYVYIKVDKDKTSTQSYTITAEDSDGNGNNSSTATYEINADNVAPSFSLGSSGAPALTDGSGDEISMTKLRNSDHVVTFGSSATDAGSGFERIAFYFKRTVTENSAGSKTIELPIPSASGTSWTNSDDAAYVGNLDSLKTDSDLTDSVDANYSGNALYGINLTGTASADSDASTTAFTVSEPASISDYKFIRAGGIIKLSGVYYTIAKVEDKTITVDGALSSSPTSAFVPAALIVDNTSAESIGTWSSGFAINGDDGDGIIESVKKSGSTWTWSASVFLDELEDGPITLVAMAFDKAGNVRTLETPVMIANNTPRLAKVYLATDLNGDGKFTDNELGTSKLADTNETVKYYSALTNGTSGRAQETLTIENQKDSGATGITMRDKLGLAFEFVGSGYEGYGSGNNSLYYKLSVGDSAFSSPESGTDGEITAVTNGAYDTANGTETASIVSAGLKGFEIPASKFKSGGDFNSSYKEWSYSNVKDGTDSNEKNYIAVTIWDSTKGTTAGEGDTVDSSGSITAFGSQWTLVNIPLYIDLVDDKFPVPSIKDPSAAAENGSALGHVDLSGTLPSATFDKDTGEFDSDTKISGTVVFTGTVTDETRVQDILLTTSSKFSSAEISSKKVAGYNSKSGKFDLAQPAEGLEFEITSNEFSTESGHTVEWKLTVDSSAVENIAAADVKFTVAASDGTNTNGAGTAEKQAEYQTDIVPYITGIVRSESTRSNKTMNRSTYGEFPVALGDTLTVSGWNFGSSPTVNVGTVACTASNAESGDSFTVSSPENSGELTVTVNSIVSLNDKNNNAAETNLDTDGKYDNRYIRVWDVGHYFSNSEGGNKPTFAVDKSGNMFTTWTLMGTGSVQLQRQLSTANKPVYIGYDQPDKETALGVDVKSTSTNGDLSVLFFPANVGSSGTPDSTCYADSMTMGGVWGLNLKNDTFANDNYKTFSENKHISIAGNPYNQLDSKICTSGYQLAGASMRREVSQFERGRTVRYGDNMHFVYYDSYNKALRYTFQKAGKKISSNDPLSEDGNYTVLTADSKNSTANRKDIVGWILIDGKSDAQDRIHRWTDNDLEYIWSNSEAGVSKLKDQFPKIEAKSITIDGTWKDGKALAIAYTDSSGVYKVDVHDNIETKISDTGNTTTFSWTDHYYPDASLTPTGLCIYKGESNVVSSGVSRTESGAVGSYSSIDVTSTGKPVIVYYDSSTETLRIAYSSKAELNMYSSTDGAGKFTRQAVSGVSGGTYVQAKIDGDNYLHIMYRDSDGKLCYLKSTNAPDGDGYTFGEPMTIDSSGTYGTLSLIKSTSGYVPCVSWLNSEGTANGVKYAVLRDVDSGSGKTESLWDVQIVPAVTYGGSNHYVAGGELVYVEGASGSWTVTDGSVSMADCDAAVGFNTGRMDVVFLKSEK